LGGYDDAFFDRLAGIEDRSFWFRVRRRLIVDLVRQVASPGDRFLEVGCGTGYVLEAVVSDCRVQATGTDPSPRALKYARGRVPEATFVELDAAVSPYGGDFDVAGAFDVLEHINDDIAALRNLRDAVRPGGYVLITVPQHPWLWSGFDEVARHARRYRRRDLLERIRSTGLEPVRTTSFVSSLLPLMAASRIMYQMRRGRAGVLDALFPPRPLDRLLEFALEQERRLIRHAIDIPVGGSLVLVARRGHEP
jgi:SAM-dependent methyltransferase